MFAAAEKYMPGVADKFQENVQWRQLKKNQPTRGRDADILWGPSSSQGEMSERGDYEGHTMESSLYTKASMHPLITAASLLGAGPSGRGPDRHRQPDAQREPTWREAARRIRSARPGAAKQLRLSHEGRIQGSPLLLATDDVFPCRPIPQTRSESAVKLGITPQELASNTPPAEPKLSLCHIRGRR